MHPQTISDPMKETRRHKLQEEQVIVGGGGEEDVLEHVGREVVDRDALEREAARAARRRRHPERGGE